MAVRISRTSARSAAALAKEHRSVLMKGIDRRFHPKILRFSSTSSPPSTPIATPAGGDNVTSPDPQPAQQAPATRGHDVRRAFFVRFHGTGFRFRPPLEIRPMSLHAFRSAPVSRLGLPGGGPTPPLPVAHSAYFWLSDLAYSADCALTTPQTSSLKAAIQSVCGTHLLPSHISIRVLPPPPWSCAVTVTGAIMPLAL